MIDTLIDFARRRECSDIHLTAGQVPQMRQYGKLINCPVAVDPNDIEGALMGLLDERQKCMLANGDDLDFAIQTKDGARQRVNIYRSEKRLCAAIRLLNDSIPSLEKLGLPAALTQLADQPRGLILVTGPTGSGKSTTLAAMIDYINERKAEHIITIEDPIEYVYTPKKSLIHQRETGRDVHSFASALRSALREDPDVILVGEMRDYETISAAVTAAETGHLVMSTLHTTGAAQTVNRIVDACPAGEQEQMRSQLSGILRGVVTQSLLPLADGSGRCAATEILIGTDAVLNLIREDKSHQLNSMMQSGMSVGMHTLNSELARLVKSGTITKETAWACTNNRADLGQYM